ncbi:MAG TPA: hypothetical protein VNK04_14465 [Gemmataceae bacterium]|nr:hypothetical protein [Gemmataceae bacterium]
MSRKSVLLATGILVLLIVGVVATLLLLIRHEPTFYRTAALPPGMSRKKHSNDFLQQLTQLISAMNDAREWSAQFTEEQINGYLEEGFRTSGLEEQMLPDDISDPRVRIEADRIRLGFRYGGLWGAVVGIDLRVWVAKKEPNVVVVELQGMQAGALPISAQSLLEHVSEAARRQNIEVTWYRHQGNPAALLRFQGKRSRATVQLQQLELHPGRLVIQGRSIDPAAARGALSAASE